MAQYKLGDIVTFDNKRYQVAEGRCSDCPFFTSRGDCNFYRVSTLTCSGSIGGYIWKKANSIISSQVSISFRKHHCLSLNFKL